MKRLLALVLSCCLIGALILSSALAQAVSPYALTHVYYDGHTMAGRVVVDPDASTLGSDALCVRAAFFMDDGSYVFVFTGLAQDNSGSFSVDFVGPVSYIAVTLFEKGVDWLEGGYALSFMEFYIK